MGINSNIILFDSSKKSDNSTRLTTRLKNLRVKAMPVR